MPSPINAQAPVRTAQPQASSRTTLIELSPGRYTFQHAGVAYSVRLSPAPTAKLDPTLHRRLQTLLRIMTTQATTDQGAPPEHMRLSPKGVTVNGAPYKSSQPARVKHYLTVMGQLFGSATDVLIGRPNLRQKFA